MTPRDQWLLALVFVTFFGGLMLLEFGSTLTWPQRFGVALLTLGASGLASFNARELRRRRQRQAETTIGEAGAGTLGGSGLALETRRREAHAISRVVGDCAHPDLPR